MKFPLRAKLPPGSGVVINVFFIFMAFDMQYEKHPLSVTRFILKANVGSMAIHRPMKGKVIMGLNH